MRCFGYFYLDLERRVEGFGFLVFFVFFELGGVCVGGVLLEIGFEVFVLLRS